MMRTMTAGLAVAAFAAGAAVPSFGQGLSLSLFDRIDRGEWELRAHGESGGTQRVCLNNDWALVQLRHKGERCRRVVVDEAPNEVTVQYTCPGRGYGRTSIRRETSRLVQIDSQGIANGLPFAFAAEARRVGNCAK